MIFFFYGEEGFLARRKTKETEEAFQKKIPSATVEIFDFTESEISKVVESLSLGGGLFSPKKLLILENPFELVEKEQLLLREAVKKLSADISIIFLQTPIKNKKGKLFSYLEKNAKVQKFEKIKGKEINRWLAKEFNSRGEGKIKISPEAIERLAIISKGDLWQLDREIEKLLNYSGKNKQIGVEEIELLCSGEADTEIFGLFDAIGQRDKKKALDLVYSFIRQGKDPLQIFSLLMYQVRNLAKVSDVAEKVGQDSRQISQKLGLHPFVVKKTLSQLQRFPRSLIKKVYCLASDLDLKAKTSQAKAQDFLIDFIMAI